ncbi:hypothetical protein Hc94105_0275 [Helicobacter cinaedi]|uniref:hypothetical protein n=1 Tax=Helicobacter cinaedi TaxID=213 RepID=UPI001F430B58|nr:hypothetical protein [Helicobacter cinaedi]BDB66090.1 hypothetical protein Hc94105_0275 [Helicobacter cinaedi]
MIGSMLVGTIIGVGFFTYKPLFSVLKKNKFSFKAAYNDYKENQETKEAFKTFATTQMDKVKRLVGSINDKTQKKFGTQEQEDTSSPSQTHKLEPATQDDNKATQSQNDSGDTAQQDIQNNNEQENTNKSQENTNQSKE